MTYKQRSLWKTIKIPVIFLFLQTFFFILLLTTGELSTFNIGWNCLNIGLWIGIVITEISNHATEKLLLTFIDLEKQYRQASAKTYEEYIQRLHEQVSDLLLVTELEGPKEEL